MIGALSIRDRIRTGRGHCPASAWSRATALSALLGYYVVSYIDFLGLHYISAQFERMILFTFPLFVVLFGAWFFGHEGDGATALIAIAIAYAGLALMFATKLGELGSRDVVLGAGFVLVAAMTFALLPAAGEAADRCGRPAALHLHRHDRRGAGGAAPVRRHPSAVATSRYAGTAFWYAVLLAVGATIAAVLPARRRTAPDFGAGQLDDRHAQPGRDDRRSPGSSSASDWTLFDVVGSGTRDRRRWRS